MIYNEKLPHQKICGSDVKIDFVLAVDERVKKFLVDRSSDDSKCVCVL